MHHILNFDANDKIKMVFNVGKGHLSYIINDEPIDTESDSNTTDIRGMHVTILQNRRI